jgi:thymidylate synthase (FAD)
MRKQAESNRQSSTDCIDESLEFRFRDDLSIIDAQLWDLYNRMIEAGVARECARNICPLYTPTKLHMNGTIRSWAHYVGLRGAEDTQKEHREIAKQIGIILAVELPVVTKALALAAAQNPDDKSLQGWLAIHPLAKDQD